MTETLERTGASVRAAREAVRAGYFRSEAEVLEGLKGGIRLDAAARGAVATAGAQIVERVRRETSPSMMESFLAEYGLSTEEGVGLMCLAEALLRVPDAETIDDLIEDKIEPSNWGAHLGRSSSSLVNASTWALMLTGKVLDDDPKGPVAAVRRAGAAARRAGGAHRGRPVDEAARAAVRARARPSTTAMTQRPGAGGQGLHLFLRHAGRGGAHRGRRGALPRRLRQGDRGDRQAGRRATCARARASRSSFRRCIRATSTPTAKR